MIVEEKNLQRIVKMHLRPEAVEDFLAHFDSIKDKIRDFPGCRGLNLLQEAERPYILFTYSRWEDNNALDHYRGSDLFKTTWAYVKTLFAQRAEAWSTHVIAQL